MRVYNGLVVETQEEARNKLKELLQKRVENLKSNIERSNEEILKLNSMLEDMRKEDEGK
jgi:chaperonin cofactor prefoldin